MQPSRTHTHYSENNDSVSITCNIVVNCHWTLLALAEYAAAFFLLGECPKDAIRICIKHLQDYDLAIFIARIRHDREVLLPWVIETYIAPRAMELNDRWLMHWCSWVQGKKEQAIMDVYVRIWKIWKICLD